MKVNINGAPPFDGSYDMDMSVPLNGRELHVIKELSGVRLGEIDDALAAGDYDLLISFAAISLTRAGKIKKEQTLRVARDVLMEAASGEILVEGDDEVEDDAVPPKVTPSEPVGTLTASESSASSSADSRSTGDDLPAISLAPTGTAG